MTEHAACVKFKGQSQRRERGRKGGVRKEDMASLALATWILDALSDFWVLEGRRVARIAWQP